MTRYIKYVTDEFLKEFKNEFLVKYAHLYKSNEMNKLKCKCQYKNVQF